MVASASPGAGEVGKTINVVVRGNNMNGATSLEFGEGVTVNSFSVASASQINASITITANAALGSRNVAVVTPRGTGRLYSGLKVQAATVTPPTPEPEERGSSNWWILWTILGVAAGCVLAGVVVFLVTKKGKAKPAA